MKLRLAVVCALAAIFAVPALSKTTPRFSGWPGVPKGPKNEIVKGQILVKYATPLLAETISLNPLYQADAEAALGRAQFRTRLHQTAWVLYLVPPGTDTKALARHLTARPEIVVAQPVNRVYPLLDIPNDPDFGAIEDDPELYFFGDPGQFYRLWHMIDSNLLAGVETAFATYPNTWYTSVTRSRKPKLIGFVDTGADLGHPDYKCAGATSVDFLQGGQIDLAHSNLWQFGEAQPDDPWDLHGHGTHVFGLGIAAGNNGGFDGHGVIGSHYGAAGQMQRVFDEQGVGTDTDAAMAIFYSADAGCDVINISLGTENFSPIFQEAITYATQRGSLCVAAGNEDGNGGGDIGPIYPAACSGALAVSANGPDYVSASETTIFLGTPIEGYGGYGYYVDVAAPGGNIVVAGDPYDPENFLAWLQFVWSTAATYHVSAMDIPNLNPPYRFNYCYLAGTSMATPIVAGAAALFMDYKRLGQKAAWGNIRTYQAIQRGAIWGGAPNGGWEMKQGYGSLDAAALLREQNERGALIGGCEGIVYLDGIATANIQVKAQKTTGINPPIFSTASKADGTYRFDGMPEGTYRVWTQGGAPSKLRTINIRNGCDISGMDFWLGFGYDISPPNGSVIAITMNGSTSQFRLSNTAYDTESGIMKMTWKMGTSRGGGETIPEREVLIGEPTRIVTGLNLTRGQLYWITYKMWNGVDLTRSISIKFIVP